jgi:putative endonuclease
MSSLNKQASYEHGLAAEMRAIKHYEVRGFTLLKHRYKTKSGEIDAVLYNEKTLIFLEVKARKTFNEGAESITPRQQLRLIATAEIFLAEHPEYSDKEMRFDIAISTSTLDIIENAITQ